jgi:DNA-binding MarR family transcriptional regulator
MSEPEACGGALAHDLGWSLGVVFRSYVAAAEAVIVDLPAGPRGYQILATAARGEITSQLALAQHMGVDRTVMTYLLDDLERAGVIERQPDPADRRARRIVATRKGRRLLARLDERLQAAEDTVLASLDSAERAAFRGYLQRVAAGATAAHTAGDACAMANKLAPQVAESSRRKPSQR